MMGYLIIITVAPMKSSSGPSSKSEHHLRVEQGPSYLTFRADLQEATTPNGISKGGWGHLHGCSQEISESVHSLATC